MRLLLLGCTGFVGRELVPFLLNLGHQLTLVSRRPGPASEAADPRITHLRFDLADPASWSQQPLLEALAAADGVVNLTGEPIADQRWTPAYRQRLLDSRLVTSEQLVRAMVALASPPKVLVSGSAVGYYGTSLEACFSEASPPGDDFLARLCARWEAAVQAAPEACRVVVLRLGIVIGPDGGALGKMLPAFRAGFGGPVGSGQQWMSWIHRHDLCRLIAAALEDPAYAGPYNAVAPEATRMGNFASTLGRVLGRPSLLPVPGPVLQLMLGDGAKVVLEGQQVKPERLLAQGFHYQFADLSAALAAATNPDPR